MRWDPPELEWLPVEAQELLRFACTRMVHSYKPVLMLAIMDQLPATEFPAKTIARRVRALLLGGGGGGGGRGGEAGAAG